MLSERDFRKAPKEGIGSRDGSLEHPGKNTGTTGRDGTPALCFFLRLAFWYVVTFRLCRWMHFRNDGTSARRGAARPGTSAESSIATRGPALALPFVIALARGEKAVKSQQTGDTSVKQRAPPISATARAWSTSKPDSAWFHPVNNSR